MPCESNGEERGSFAICEKGADGIEKIGDGATWKELFYIEKEKQTEIMLRDTGPLEQRRRMGFKSLNSISHKTHLLETVPREYS